MGAVGAFGRGAEPHVVVEFARRGVAGRRAESWAVIFGSSTSRSRASGASIPRRVHSGLSAKTTVVVRGRPNPLQAAGKDAGIKLMEIKRLRAKGQRITLLNETQFWQLAGVKR